MINISATSNVEALSRAFRLLGEKQMPFALAVAATRTGQIVKAKLLAELIATVDRPTPQTQKALYLRTANKKKPEARVWFKDDWNSGIPADRYLEPQVAGGARRPKRLEVALRKRGILGGNEWAIPTTDVLNQYGNMPGALAMKILSGLGAAETNAGVTANASGSAKSKKKGNARRFFVAKIKKTKAVWERKNTAFGVAIRPVLVFVTRQPTYRERYKFFEIAQQTVAENYLPVFMDAVDRAVQSANPA